MYIVTFTDLKSALALNNLKEAEVVRILKSAMENKNYRETYNGRKTALNQLLRTDPVVVERMKALKVAK